MTDSDYTLAAPKCACGNTITKFFQSGKPGKFCTECRDKQAGKHRVGERHIACAQCSKPIATNLPHQKFCSDKCKCTARERARGHQPRQCRPILQCKHCNVTFRPARPECSSYCSRECAFAAKAATPSCPIYTGYCMRCEGPIVSRRARKFCSAQCWTPAMHEPTEPLSVVCKVCSGTFKSKTFGRPEGFCSAACRAVRDKALRRMSKASRRARLRGVKVERVDPFKVFRRDKWRCQLCGIKTPEALRGTHEDAAPELDHIVTLAEGGEHSYRNTQCACRKCNQRKSSRSMGQTLLFG